MTDVTRYTDQEIADAYTRFRMAIKGQQVNVVEYVLASDYDALAAELAEAQRQLKMVAPIGRYNGRDIEGWAKHAAALEAALRTIEAKGREHPDPYVPGAWFADVACVWRDTSPTETD